MRTYNRLQPAHKVSVSQIEDLCRLCMNVDFSMYDIFTVCEENGAVSLASKILKCLSIEVKNSNGFPTKLCARCLKSLNAFTEFWEQCQTTNIKLHQLIEHSHPSGPYEVVHESSPLYSGYDELYKSPERTDVNSADDGDPTITESLNYNPFIDSSDSVLTVECTKKIPLQKSAGNDVSELSDEIRDEVPPEVNLSENETSTFVGADSPSNFQLETVVEMDEESDSVEVQVSMNGNSYIVTVLDQMQASISTKASDGNRDIDKELSQNKDALPVSQSKICLQCPLCQESFDNSLDLKTHEKTHKDTKGFKCNICSKWFAIRSSLVRHEKIHSGERPFKCEQCPRSFTQKEVLRRHALIHSGNKPFKCDSCDKSYTQKEALRMHVKNNHVLRKFVEIVQYKCPLCEKSFCHLSGLSRHQRSHAGKKYPCNSCDRVFTDQSCLKRHTQRVHLSGKSETNPKITTNNTGKQGKVA